MSNQYRPNSVPSTLWYEKINIYGVYVKEVRFYDIADYSIRIIEPSSEEMLEEKDESALPKLKPEMLEEQTRPLSLVASHLRR